MSYFNPTKVIIQSFLEEIKKAYTFTYGSYRIELSETLQWAGNMALEIIANSDALYHNLEHTVHVTLVGQQILMSKQIKEGRVPPEDWLHFVISLLCHDIGYIKGVCRDDNIETMTFATGIDEPQFVTLPPGSTDAGLTKYHVDRGKLFVKERFGSSLLGIIDPDIISKNIELTRFPVPDSEDHKDTVGYPGLVRAADLIGQLSDPRYLEKIPALYYEFLETGESEHQGWKNPGDLRKTYPGFFWNIVFPYVEPSIKFLKVTQTGKQYLSSLFSQVAQVENF